MDIQNMTSDECCAAISAILDRLEELEEEKMRMELEYEQWYRENVAETTEFICPFSGEPL
jgi:uncharacterized protein (UPF0335 family)